MLARKRINNIIKYLIPSIITLVIIGIAFSLNNLYPFGIKSMVQVDADYIYAPILYKIYDILHGASNIFYSDIGLGSSIYGSLIIQGSLYSPFNLLLYFINRNDIINFFSIFIIIKICLISLTSYIYINHKYFNIQYFYKVLFSILYAFSGFVLLNCFNEIWLDLVILFPLLVMYLDKLFEEGKELGYIIILSLCLIISAYFSMFIIVFILFYSFVNLYILNFKNIKLKINDIKSKIFKLGKATLIAFLISSFSSIPLLYQILNSDRFNWDSTVSVFNNINMKSLYLLFCPLFVIMFFKLLFKFRKDKKNILKYLILITLYLIPLILDPINMLMHGGSYWSFPYRYGFIPIFLLMDSSLYYLLKFHQDSEQHNNIFNIIMVINIIMLGLGGLFLHHKYADIITGSNVLLSISNYIYLMVIKIIAVVLAMYILVMLINNKYLRKTMLMIVSLYAILSFSSITIYHGDGYWLTEKAQGISSNMTIKKDGIYKIDSTDYTPYYGYILDVTSLDNWVHIIPKNLKETYQKLGYHTVDTKVYSIGGTIFSDWLLNFKYYITSEDISNDMMTSIDTYNDYYHLYQYNYNNNYGIVFNNLDNSFDDNMNKFEYQNNIYHNLFNTKENIIDYQNFIFTDKELIELKYNIPKDGYLYLYCDEAHAIESIIINDKIISNYYHAIKYLGRYDHDVNIQISLTKGYSDVEFSIGYIKNSDILNLKSDVKYQDNKYYINSSDDNNYLFLPINNIKGIHIYNNDQEIDSMKYLDNFICLKLNKGENVISYKYKLPLFKISIILSIIGLLCLIFYKRIKDNKLLLTISFWAYNIIILFILIYYYIYPFC